jgi:hypothetical protein
MKMNQSKVKNLLTSRKMKLNKLRMDGMVVGYNGNCPIFLLSLTERINLIAQLKNQRLPNKRR